MQKGIVKTFSIRNGFGYIKTELDDKLFVHHSDIQRGNILKPGVTVEFELGTGVNGHACAINVRVITTIGGKLKSLFHA